MRHAIISLALAAAFSAPAAASDKGDAWTAAQKTAYTASIVANLVDWRQTRTIAKHPEQWRELNPFLGRHPSVSRVNNYFLGTTAILALAPHVSPFYRKHMMGPVAVYLSVNALRNYHIGIRMDF